MDTKYLILNFAIVCIFIIASIVAVKKKGYIAFTLVFVVMLVISLLSTIGMYGIGHTWDIASVIGKVTAILITLSIPLGLASIPIVTLYNKNIHSAFIGVISFLLSYLAVINIHVIGIVLVCFLSGDCL